ncbi:HPr family phosphocarrier protein [Bacillus sp. V2I10]|uniref:HPr family phosphocarrier protein n=1 Tax=Bacillus sp. V2I10 TaxID=3042276 RepID=UPI0027889782|nr:HPr family phosphocarrier protein [Bacillus sp. V2I10]MDQ0858817.1 phosphotransferase system HPr (HPr) family protein [Bacillus sp. V2I10]
MIQQTVELNSIGGLYGRSATELIRTASRYSSDIFLTYKGRRVNVKSILGVLSLGIQNKAELKLEASGRDEEEALQQVIKTLASLD